MPGSTGPQSRLRTLSAALFRILDEMSEAVTCRDAHRLRTTIRRIEVALEPLGKFEGSKKLQRHLDALRRTAGHIRDIDVQSELLKGLHAEDYGTDCNALRTVLIDRRAKQEKKTIARVRRESDKGLRSRLEDAGKLVAQAPPVKAPSSERVAHLRQQYIEFTREVPQDGTPLHNLRKACKRLRYRLEAVPGREARAFEKHLKTVQDAIGAWHDWATLTAQAERRLSPRSIAFVAYLRSITLSKRNEARRVVLALRDRLTKSRVPRKPPTRASHETPRHRVAR